MYTYVQRPGCKKENTATYVYIWAGSRTPTRAYVRPGLVYMAGSEWRNSVIVVFMGRQQNAPCSWGGNKMRRVHGEATERVGANRLGRNGMRGRVHREGLDGTGNGNEARRTAERRKRTSYSRNGGPVDREGCGVPQNGTPRDTVHLHHRPPPASTGYRRPPPASTGSYSSSLHRALLHRLLFNHPSTGTPPPSTVHPTLHHTTGSCSSRGNATAHCSSNPPTPGNTHCSSQRQHRSASVSSSSEGIARSGSVNSHRSIARVQ